MLPVISVYVLAVLVLCAGFHFSGIMQTLASVSKAARLAVSIFTDDMLDDLEKEKAIQRCAVDMLKQAVALITKMLLILLFTVFPVWLARGAGWIDIGVFMRFIMRWEVIFLTTLAVALPVFALSRYRKTDR